LNHDGHPSKQVDEKRAWGLVAAGLPRHNLNVRNPRWRRKAASIDFFINLLDGNN